MTRAEGIAALELRIAQEEEKRDAWRIAGPEEKYLEAYSMVEALELQLERALLLREGVTVSSGIDVVTPLRPDKADL